MGVYVMTDFKPIETQEELDAIIRNRLERERNTFEKKYEGFDQMKDELTALRQEKDNFSSMLGEKENVIAELTTARDEKETMIKDLQSQIQARDKKDMKVRIALEMGLPHEMASRINGDDEESIRKDASTLLSFVQAKPTPPKKNPESKVKEDSYTKLLSGLNKG